MVSIFPFQQLTQHRPSPNRRFNRWRKVLATSTMAIALGLTAPAFAGDPFRSENPRAIGDQTEAAFRAMFEEGNYIEAQELLQTAESDEPLNYAIRAAVGYLDEDWGTLEENAALTLQAAEPLIDSDPLRGNLYMAIGHFLEGTHTLMTQGTVRGTPAALQKLQLVFDYMGQAEEIDPQDPELNLVKGFMDLMIAVNLPFTDPQTAIARLENYAAPVYLSQRGIAIAYRDLDQQDRAMQAVDQALAAAPDNPDLLYLKAQIFVQQGKDRESLEFFNLALEKESQLHSGLAERIAWERCRTQNRISGEDRNCDRVVANRSN